MAATERDVAFTGSSKLYGAPTAAGGGAGSLPSATTGVKFRVLVHENARQRRTPGASKAGKYDYLVPSSGRGGMDTAKVTPVGLGHDFGSVIAATPARVGRDGSPEERRRLLRLQVLQAESQQAQNALGAIESARRAEARREREEIQETGTLSTLVSVALRRGGSALSQARHAVPR